jgi:hypothetical protein
MLCRKMEKALCSLRACRREWEALAQPRTSLDRGKQTEVLLSVTVIWCSLEKVHRLLSVVLAVKEVSVLETKFSNCLKILAHTRSRLWNSMMKMTGYSSVMDHSSCYKHRTKMVEYT